LVMAPLRRLPHPSFDGCSSGPSIVHGPPEVMVESV
jgi:hypothetical protein